MSSHTERVIDRISRSCSLDRVFVAGEGAHSIADQLRLRGSVVVESPSATMSAVTSDLLSATEPFSVCVVCISAPDLSDEDARYLFAALRRAAQTAYVNVAASAAPRRAEDIGSRTWWERHAVASGFRRHPHYSHLISYEELDAPGVTPWLLLEVVSHQSESPKDELRVVGRDADATLWRYARASHFVRRNDRVLDLDCGVGAGLAQIGPAALAASVVGLVRDEADLEYARAHYAAGQAALEFRIGPPRDLSQFPNESIDVVMSCRSLRSGSWSPEAFDEIERVLTPGGRLILCVDEADLSVREELAGRFLLERVLGQRGPDTEPGGALPSWHEIELDSPREGRCADWWLLVTMKDPMWGIGATYRERLYPRAAFPGGPNPTRYIESFENPWLHSSVFNIGARVTRATLLEQLCRDVAREKPKSMDAAAAHCVLAYQLLEGAPVAPEAIRAWLEDVQPVMRTLVDDAPATVRWRVSLLFVAGRLAMRTSDNLTAIRYLRACMSEDATKFSSLLATKTIEAAYWAGFLLARGGDFESAAAAWSRGVAIAKTCIAAEAVASASNVREPLELFGFREFSQVFDVAGRCAAGLAALEEGPRWEQRLSALLPHASAATGWSASVKEARWALEDERACAREAFCALQWQRDAQLFDVKASTNDALLRQIVHRCRASERSVVVWGAGAAGRRVLNLVLDLDGAVDAFVDSSAAKHRTSVAGRPVIAPWVLASPEWVGSFVLIGSMHASEIETTLVQLGFRRHDDFMRVDFAVCLS